MECQTISKLYKLRSGEMMIAYTGNLGADIARARGAPTYEKLLQQLYYELENLERLGAIRLTKIPKTQNRENGQPIDFMYHVTAV